MTKYLTVLGGIAAEVWDTELPFPMFGMWVDHTGMTFDQALAWAMGYTRVVPIGPAHLDTEIPCPLTEARDGTDPRDSLVWVELTDSTSWSVVLSEDSLSMLCSEERRV